MMNMELTDKRCPQCHGTLVNSATGYRCEHNHEFGLTNGMISFLGQNDISPEVVKSNNEYKETAKAYDEMMSWYFHVLNEDENEVRQTMVDQLNIKKGDSILELGCGTGSDSQLILNQIGKSGSLSLVEISPDMLSLAKEKLSDLANDRVEYILADANALPFADNIFDAAFHFGGFNNFPDQEKALQEFNRVVKPGGKVVIGDESVPPWLRNTAYGQTMMNYNSQYKHELDLSILDPKCRNVNVRWIFGNLYYLIDYEVSDESLEIKKDVKNPFFNLSIAEWIAEKNSNVD